MLSFDLTTFLLCKVITENENSDAIAADRVALLTSCMGLGLVETAIFASVLGKPAPSTNTRAATAARPTAARVKVPSVKTLSSEQEIHEYLQKHGLRAKIHRERKPELKAPQVLFQSPDPDEEIDKFGEVTILMQVPSDQPNRHGAGQARK